MITPGSPQQPATSASSPNPQAASAPLHPDNALENILLEQADQEHITYMDSHVALKYNHDEFEVGSGLDRFCAHWL